MKIMIFLHGTAIMHKSGVNVDQQERVRQSARRDPDVLDYSNYVPVGKAVEKINKWSLQGAEIFYLSSHKDEDNVRKDIEVLSRNHFPKGSVLYRHDKETYAEIAERVMPDVLIEDDCASIGGESEMTSPHVNPKKKKLIKSIVVKEFSGIDTFPDNINELIGSPLLN